MKFQKAQKLFALLLALVLVFSAAIPVQAESEEVAITKSSAYLEQLYYETFSEPDNPIVSQEPYLCTGEEAAAFEADGQSDTILLTYADGSTAIVSAVPVNARQPSEAYTCLPDWLVYSVHVVMAISCNAINVGN
ncbi:hypothetical protein AALA61_11200 [Oscillospiraceae bacterium 42-9]